MKIRRKNRRPNDTTAYPFTIKGKIPVVETSIDIEYYIGST